MAVIVEGISVIVRCESIEASYPGGWEGYVKDAPNQTFCTDELLARVGFMARFDVGTFISRLAGLGFEFVRDDKAIDVCVVDQHQGPTSWCDWLEYGHMDILGTTDRVAACWAVGDTRLEFAVPDGWNFQNSLTRDHNFIPNENVRERLELIRHENGVDVFRDRSSGKEVYMGRT